MKMTPEQIRRIVDLARIHLQPEEIEAFSRQLSSIIEYVDLLAEADTAGIEPLPQVNAAANVLRADAVTACDESTRRALIDQFPEADDDLLKVQAVFS